MIQLFAWVVIGIFVLDVIGKLCCIKGGIMVRSTAGMAFDIAVNTAVAVWGITLLVGAK